MTQKELLFEIFAAGLKAVQPDQAIMCHLRRNGDKLIAAGKEYDLAQGKTFIVGAGKGAAPMLKAAEELLKDKIHAGAAVVKYGHELPLKRLNILQASHPVPDSAGQKAAEAILDLALQAGPEDLLVCLITGGASALLPLSAHGLTLGELQEATSLLLASGANIHELNAIRKHLSRIAGGQLAKAANGAKVLSLIVSDVVGDDLATIASGPTAPDASTYTDCLAIIAKYDLAAKMPARVMKVLEEGAAGNLPETPKPDSDVFKNVKNIIVASNLQALEAAAAKAKELGLNVEIWPEPLTGEASEAANLLIDRARAISARLKPGDKGVCLLAGGETTVTIKGHGLGGRNQEMALTASIALERESGISALFAGTDGTDGPTDAAGGYATPESAAKMNGKSREYLANNDSYHALKEAGDLLITGPTRTNVMDLAIILISPPALA